MYACRYALLIRMDKRYVYVYGICVRMIWSRLCKFGWKPIQETHDFIPKDYWLNQFDTTKKLIPHAEVYVCECDGKTAGFIGHPDCLNVYKRMSEP